MEIYIVNDEIQESQKVQRLLLEISIKHDYEFETTLFLSGEELLTHFSEKKHPPFMIILDIEIGEINGLETARQLREDYGYQGQLVFLTTHKEFVFDSLA